MMDVLISLKLLSSDPFRLGDIELSPREYLEKYLTATIKAVGVYREEQKALQVDIFGKRDGNRSAWRYETVVASNRELDLSSSSYWTSVPLSIVAAMLARGDINKTGVLAPETAVEPVLFLGELETFGIRVREEELETRQDVG